MSELLMVYSAICYLMFIGFVIEDDDKVKRHPLVSFMLFLFSPAVVPIIVGISLIN